MCFSDTRYRITNNLTILTQVLFCQRVCTSSWVAPLVGVVTPSRLVDLSVWPTEAHATSDATENRSAHSSMQRPSGLNTAQQPSLQ